MTTSLKTPAAALRIVREDDIMMSQALKDVTEALLSGRPDIDAVITLLIEDPYSWRDYLSVNKHRTVRRGPEESFIALSANGLWWAPEKGPASDPMRRVPYWHRRRLRKAILINQALRLLKELP